MADQTAIAMQVAFDALEEIALAGMSPSPEMSDDAITAWHANQAWRFISIAARAITALRAALSAAPAGEVQTPSQAPAVPEGWRLVPVEPDDAMQQAGALAIRFDTTVLNKLWTANAVYRAQIAAAPQPPLAAAKQEASKLDAWMPQGWRFYYADASVIGRCSVMLELDPAGRSASLALSSEDRATRPLYVSAAGPSLETALDAAINAAIASSQEPKQ